MKKQTVYWVRFFAPGSFVANEWTKDYDEQPRPNDIEWPDNAYAFTVHKRVDALDGDDTYKGKPEQIGPIYYHPESKVETLEEVRHNPNATDILIQNMERNGWAEIIWTRWGNWPQEYDATKHQVLAA